MAAEFERFGDLGPRAGNLWLQIFYLYQRDLGLTDQQIFGIQAIYYVAFCLLDVPTGVLADQR